MFCEICGAKLKWYHKRVEFTFGRPIRIDKDESQLYTWTEAVCSSCVPKEARKKFGKKKKKGDDDDDTSNKDYIYNG